jgi:hypothetical protein
MPPITANLETEAFLHAHGLRVKPEALDPMVQEAISRLQRELFRPEPRLDLTEQEAAVLERGGFVLEPENLETEDPLSKTAANYAALLTTSLPAATAAAKLGVSAAWLHRLLAASPRKLFGVRLASGWVLPAFQFGPEGLVPGISEVVAKLDPELHPLAVYRWFTNPNPDLYVDEREEPVAPVDWLRLGLPAEPVARMAGNL